MQWTPTSFAGLWRACSTPDGPHHRVNSYFLQTLRGAVLIDPAFDCAPDSLPSAPDAILITHVQNEHIAGAGNFPNVPLYVPAGDEYLCKGKAHYETHISAWPPPWEWETRGNFQGHLAGARNERPPENALPVSGVLQAGDEIFGLRIISTPGHGKHALSFIAEIGTEKIAWCGDVICGDGQMWNWFDCEWDYGLEDGPRAVSASAKKLQDENCAALFPSHGEMIEHPAHALKNLQERLAPILAPGESPYHLLEPLNFPDRDSPANGWRELSTHLHQWKAGNCAALVSQSGNALLIDDGLCYWEPLEKRALFHREVMQELKQKLGIAKIEVCIPTHFHGDHTEYIPHLVEEENCRVISLDVVADVLEQPENFNLAAMPWWYGFERHLVPIHKRIASGAVFQWHEYELEIFHLGGQTFFHAGIAVHVDGKKVVFCGDAIYGWSPDCEPVLCYNDAAPSTRGWAYSLERMIERAPDLLVCGHGSSVCDPAPLLKLKKEKWEKRLLEYSRLNARGDERLFFDPFG